MDLEVTIAKKYFFPKNKDFFRRISLVSIITVFISVFLPLFILGVLNGFHKNIIDKIISKDFHIQVFDESDKFFDYDDIITHIQKKYPDATGVPYFEGGAILSKENVKTSCLVRGIPSNVEFIKKSFPVIKGRWKLNDHSITIGYNIAKNLRVKEGDIIEVFVKPYGNTSAEVPVRKKRLKVAGIFKTGYEEIDANLIFMSFKKARNFFRYGERAWGVGFFVKNLKNVPKIKKEIKHLNFYLNVKDWQETNRNILFSFKWEKLIMSIVLLIIIIATLFSVYIGFNVVVSDRKKDIGILKTLGLSSYRIENIFLIKGLFISIISISLATLFSFLILYNLKDILFLLEKSFSFFSKNIQIISKDSSYRSGFLFEWDFFDFIWVYFLNIISVLIATFYPVRRINKYTISESVRNV